MFPLLEEETLRERLHLAPIDFGLGLDRKGQVVVLGEGPIRID